MRILKESKCHCSMFIRHRIKQSIKQQCVGITNDTNLSNDQWADKDQKTE